MWSRPGMDHPADKRCQRSADHAQLSADMSPRRPPLTTRQGASPLRVERSWDDLRSLDPIAVLNALAGLAGAPEVRGQGGAQRRIVSTIRMVVGPGTHANCAAGP